MHRAGGLGTAHPLRDLPGGTGRSPGQVTERLAGVATVSVPWIA